MTLLLTNNNMGKRVRVVMPERVWVAQTQKATGCVRMGGLRQRQAGYVREKLAQP
jgi:hypothetical protein